MSVCCRDHNHLPLRFGVEYHNYRLTWMVGWKKWLRPGEQYDSPHEKVVVVGNLYKLSWTCKCRHYCFVISVTIVHEKSIAKFLLASRKLRLKARDLKVCEQGNWAAQPALHKRACLVACRQYLFLFNWIGKLVRNYYLLYKKSLGAEEWFFKFTLSVTHYDLYLQC